MNKESLYNVRCLTMTDNNRRRCKTKTYADLLYLKPHTNTTISPKSLVEILN